MSDDRLRRLEGIGFKWWRRDPQLAAAVLTWEDSFEELSRYHATHGQCNLSQVEGRLGRWVASQRKAFRLRKEGKVGESCIFDDKIRGLEGIGFKWWRRDPQLAAAVLTWEDSFEKLSRYHATHGHCNLSKLEGRLGRWVASQRTAFRLRKEGKVG